jgi:hypothetical protein
MSRRSLSAAVAAAILLLSGSHLLAGPSADLVQRFQGAQRAVVGKIASAEARWERNQWGDELIVTRMTVDVEETLRGVASRRLAVDVEGGTIDGLTLHVAHQPELSPGDRAVLILNEVQSGVHVPHRKGLGLLRLDANNNVEGTSTTLADVRAAARSATR